jgi:hypothetical protein
LDCSYVVGGITLEGEGKMDADETGTVEVRKTLTGFTDISLWLLGGRHLAGNLRLNDEEVEQLKKGLNCRWRGKDG